MFEKIGMFKRIPDTLLTRNIPHIPEIWSNLAKSNTQQRGKSNILAWAALLSSRNNKI